MVDIHASSKNIHLTAVVHPTAIVDPSAQIAEGVKIGPYCIVGGQVKIGQQTELMSHVIVDGRTTLGENNKIYPFASLGGVPQDLKYQGEPTELFIGDHNTIREYVTINLGTVQGGGKTVLGDHNLLMANVHLGHDTQVGNHCIFANSTALAGHVVIEDYVNLGGLVAVVQFIRVGNGAYVGTKSVLDRDIPPYGIAVGARPCELKSANLVGLKRRGLAAATISAIHDAIKLWKNTDYTKDEVLSKIESEFKEVKEVLNFVNFIRNSKNGCIR